jgi:Uma2 family endonuclease
MTLSKDRQEPTRSPLRFTYSQLRKMDHAGILGDKRVELIDGELIVMSPPNPAHAIVTTELAESLSQAFGEQGKVSVQNPLRLSPDLADRNLPMPDLVVMKRRAYRDHPQPDDVYILIEIADTTLTFDSSKKLALYAEHGVREYWIVNLIDKQIEVYTEPKGADYSARQTHALTESFAPKQFPQMARPWLTEEIYELLG